MNAIPNDITARDGGTALRLLPEDDVREVTARAVAIETIVATLHSGDGSAREAGDPTFASLLWLAEGLRLKLDAVEARWTVATNGEAS